jgi:hypothetical protein
MDEDLNLNETEKAQTIFRLTGIWPGRDREDMMRCIVDDQKPRKDDLAPIRSRMESHIQRNIRKLRTQLPGCDGKCTTFGCPALIVVRCWDGFRDDVL